MKLNLREKESFYHELEQFVRSGIALPQAVDALLPESARGAIRQNLQRLEEFFRRGESVPNAFAGLQPAISDMEVAMIAASNNSGRLEQALAYLSKYFGTLAATRSTVITQLIWPLLQLHVGIALTEVIHQLQRAGGFDANNFFLRLGVAYGGLYLGCFVLWVIGSSLLRMGRVNAAVDRVLRMLPLVGGLRCNMALSRFCATFEMQLQAGINMMDTLSAAASASHSALIDRDIKNILPRILGGQKAGDLLAGSRAFPAAFRRVMHIGEQTGSLDDDLRKWADYYQNAALRNLQIIGSWVPKIIYFAVAAYLAYNIIVGWQGQLQQISNFGDL